MSTSSMLARIDNWVAGAELRYLDAAFARFIVSLEPEASATVALCAALLSQLESRGHTCIDLDLPLHSLFESGQSLAAYLHTLDPAELCHELAAAQSLWLPEHQADAGQPWILHGHRLYLRRYYHYQSQLVRSIVARLVDVDVDEARLAQALARMFPAHDEGLDEQKLACAIAMLGRLSLITGGPGTGKTYTVARLLAILHLLHGGERPLRIALAAPTGKAAARLKQSISKAMGGLHAAGVELEADIPAMTLHRLLGTRLHTRRFVHDAAHPLPLDVLIVDEASMVHLEMMMHVLAALPVQARIVLLGDKDQLASVEAGSVLSDLCMEAQTHGYRPEKVAQLERLGFKIPKCMRDEQASPLLQHRAMLSRSQRFQGDLATWTQALQQGHDEQALQLFAGASTVLRAYEPCSPALLVQLAVEGYRPYLERLRDGPAVDESVQDWMLDVLRLFDRLRLLSALRGGEWGVAAINRGIEAALAQAGWIAPQNPWYIGRPLMITQNQAEIDLYNGDIGMVMSAPGESARVYFAQGEHLHSVAIARLAETETAYAMTVHKSQGSEFAHVVLILPDSPALTRELIYTGVTRAQTQVSLLSVRPGLLREGLARRSRRHSGLAPALQEAMQEESPC